MAVEWNKKYETGIEEFDEEHRIFFSITARFIETIKTRNSDNSVSKTFAELYKYAKSHFHMEEDAMERCEYPHYERHKKEHKSIVDSLDKLYSRYREGDEDVTVELLGFLTNWPEKHIPTYDRNLSIWLKHAGKK